MNKLVAVGRIGRDAEVRHTGSGTALASFPVAVDIGYGEKSDAQWYNCVIFGKRAEGGLIQYLTKGAQVVIDGSPKLNQYTKQDGTHGANIEVVINDITLVGGRSEPQQASSPQPAPANFDSDVPF